MTKVPKFFTNHNAIAESCWFKHQTNTNFDAKSLKFSKKVSQIWISFMILPYRSAMQCLRPKSAKTCFSEKFTHTLPKIAKQNQKRPNLCEKLLIAHARFQRDGNCNFEKITNFRKKRFRKKIFENFKFFSRCLVGECNFFSLIWQ